jgi:cyanophycinase-like exopeptidase
MSSAKARWHRCRPGRLLPGSRPPGPGPGPKRKRRRQDCKRWQREAPTQLWQLDITASVFLTDGTELKLISGLDDHSLYCVIATVVRRGTARAQSAGAPVMG